MCNIPYSTKPIQQVTPSGFGTIVAVPLSPFNKREVLKTPYIQIWCRCGYLSAPH